MAMHPDLRDLRSDLERRLARPVRMTGSGSTLFTLYDTADEAHDAARLAGSLTRALPVSLCPDRARE